MRHAIARKDVFKRHHDLLVSWPSVSVHGRYAMIVKSSLMPLVSLPSTAPPIDTSRRYVPPPYTHQRPGKGIELALLSSINYDLSINCLLAGKSLLLE